MSITGFIRGQYLSWLIPREKRRLLQQAAPAELETADWPRSLREPTAFYLDYFRFFAQRARAELKQHRAYFLEGRKGFGEDAMHVMWQQLFLKFKPSNFLEIGVFRGQIVSLASLLARLNQAPCEIYGISPFLPAGDSVSTYAEKIDYLPDTLQNFEHFSLPRPQLLKAFSTDAAAVALIRSKTWDMIYIDGNHDYEVVAQDWQVCSQSVRTGGVIVLDDAGLTTHFRPPAFAIGGHPGPSRLAQEIDRAHFQEILQVGHNRVFQKIS